MWTYIDTWTLLLNNLLEFLLFRCFKMFCVLDFKNFSQLSQTWWTLTLLIITCNEETKTRYTEIYWDRTCKLVSSVWQEASQFQADTTYLHAFSLEDVYDALVATFYKLHTEKGHCSSLIWILYSLSTLSSIFYMSDWDTLRCTGSGGAWSGVNRISD